MGESIKVAAAQFRVSADPVANGEQIHALMRTARQQGARIVHFPEGALSGYPGLLDARQRMTSWEVGWERLRVGLERTAALAAELGLWVVVGSNHRLMSPNRPHNSLYVISDDGQLAGRYDKRLCSHSEITNWYTPGFDPLVFEVDGFRFGCAVCIEVNFPELFVEYGSLGVDCVLFSTFSDDPIFDTLARAHAAANNIWMSVSVPAQFSSAMPAGVVGPHGYWLSACPSDDGPAVVTVDLDRGDPDLHVALNRARPWRAVARSGALYEQYRVDDPRSLDRLTF